MNFHPISNANQVAVIKPGTYYLGDPSYAFPAEPWDDMRALWEYYEELTATLPEGRELLAYTTLNGEGHYQDNHGNDYIVDASLIGFTPLEAVQSDRENLERVGRILTLEKEIRCYRTKDGVLYFGDIVIRTGDGE